MKIEDVKTIKDLHDYADQAAKKFGERAKADLGIKDSEEETTEIMQRIIDLEFLDSI